MHHARNSAGSTYARPVPAAASRVLPAHKPAYRPSHSARPSTVRPPSLKLSSPGAPRTLASAASNPYTALRSTPAPLAKLAQPQVPLYTLVKVSQQPTPRPAAQPKAVKEAPKTVLSLTKTAPATPTHNTAVLPEAAVEHIDINSLEASHERSLTVDATKRLTFSVPLAQVLDRLAKDGSAELTVRFTATPDAPETVHLFYAFSNTTAPQPAEPLLVQAAQRVSNVRQSVVEGGKEVLTRAAEAVLPEPAEGVLPEPAEGVEGEEPLTDEQVKVNAALDNVIDSQAVIGATSVVAPA